MGAAPNTRTYNELIRAARIACLPRRVHSLWARMLRLGPRPDQYTRAVVLCAAADCGAADPDWLLAVHAAGDALGLEPSWRGVTALAYAMRVCPRRAPEHVRDVFAVAARVRAALGLDVWAYSELMQLAAAAGEPERAADLAAACIEDGCTPSVFFYSALFKCVAVGPTREMMDLADAGWKDRWAASPAGADFQAIVSAMLALKGEAATLDWLKAMKTNVKAYKGNGAAMKAVKAGQVDGAVIYHYYYFGDQARTGENSGNVALHYFRNADPGAFVSLSGGGALASSKKQAAAQAFLKWITGKGGQDILRTGNAFEYAVGVGMQSNPKLVPLADLQAPKVEPSKLNSKKVTDLMTAAGLL